MPLALGISRPRILVNVNPVHPFFLALLKASSWKQIPSVPLSARLLVDHPGGENSKFCIPDLPSCSPIIAV